MSTQIIAALRRRADALEVEAEQTAAWPSNTPGPAGSTRPPGVLTLIAAEFRSLADEAEGAL